MKFQLKTLTGVCCSKNARELFCFCTLIAAISTSVWWTSSWLRMLETTGVFFKRHQQTKRYVTFPFLSFLFLCAIFLVFSLIFFIFNIVFFFFFATFFSFFFFVFFDIFFSSFTRLSICCEWMFCSGDFYVFLLFSFHFFLFLLFLYFFMLLFVVVGVILLIIFFISTVLDEDYNNNNYYNSYYYYCYNNFFPFFLVRFLPHLAVVLIAVAVVVVGFSFFSLFLKSSCKQGFLRCEPSTRVQRRKEQKNYCTFAI